LRPLRLERHYADGGGRDVEGLEMIERDMHEVGEGSLDDVTVAEQRDDFTCVFIAQDRDASDDSSLYVEECFA
jgi:hypothetical protein